jgi:hypothetical protein
MPKSAAKAEQPLLALSEARLTGYCEKMNAADAAFSFDISSRPYIEAHC